MRVQKNSMTYFILIYLSQCLCDTGIFTGAELCGYVRRHLRARGKHALESTIMRTVRMLRQHGIIDYEVIDPKQSVYKLHHISPYGIRTKAKVLKTEGVWII